MTFFYDLNKRLQQLAGAEQKQQINEGAEAVAERATGDYSAKKARAGKDIGKPGKAFKQIAKDAAERYGSKEKGEKVAEKLNRMYIVENVVYYGMRSIMEKYNLKSMSAVEYRLRSTSNKFKEWKYGY